VNQPQPQQVAPPPPIAAAPISRGPAPLPVQASAPAPVPQAPPPLNFIAQGGGQMDHDLATFQKTVEQSVVAEQHTEKIVVETASVATGGLAVGYVLWLIRGGYLLSSLLSSMPAWRLVDPLPILDYLDDEGRDDRNHEDEDESLEELLKKGRRSRAESI
jgi:hypothetical protein